MKDKLLAGLVTGDINIDEYITGGMQFAKWRCHLGVSRYEGDRWQDRGWVTCIRIGKTLYISVDTIRDFWRRANAGEFAGELHGICGPEKDALRETKKESEKVKRLTSCQLQRQPLAPSGRIWC